MYMSTSARRDSSGSSHSSSSSPRGHRPRLLRSAATAPSITPSNGVQASLVSPHSPQRSAAADLLNKVAVYVPASSAGVVVSHHHHHHHHHHEMMTQTAGPIMIGRPGGSTSSSSSGDMSSALSDGYFSFPNFDEWDSPKQEDSEKEAYT